MITTCVSPIVIPGTRCRHTRPSPSASSQIVSRGLNVRQADYAPFSDVFPKAACVVHHGGLGTSGQALRAGVPQLVMPLAYDQADNATRMRRLGVASVLFPKRFTGTAVAERLKLLLTDDRIKQSARKVRERFTGVDSVSTACALIEELVGRDEK